MFSTGDEATTLCAGTAELLLTTVSLRDIGPHRVKILNWSTHGAGSSLSRIVLVYVSRRKDVMLQRIFDSLHLATGCRIVYRDGSEFVIVDSEKKTHPNEDHVAGGGEDRRAIAKAGSRTGQGRPFPEATIRRWQAKVVEAARVSLEEEVEYPVPTVGTFGLNDGQYVFVYMKRRSTKTVTQPFWDNIQKELP